MKRVHKQKTNFICFVVVIILLVLMCFYIQKTYSFYKININYDVIKSKIANFKGSIINVNYYIDNQLVPNVPDKSINKFLNVSCDNAIGIWNENTQYLTISNPKTKVVNCNVKYARILNLYNTIVSQSLGLDTLVGLNYDEISSDTNGKGVYSTNNTDSGKEVYFYRGNIDNNNIIFANYCWKIIRTTETNGIKLLYNGIPINGECDNTGVNSIAIKTVWNELSDDNAYVGYMYGTAGSNNYAATHSNINDSTAKKEVDKWYEKNLKNNYENYIEDTVYCSDRTIVAPGDNNSFASSYNTLGYGKNGTAYGNVARATYETYVTKPTLKCKLVNDRFTISTLNGNGNLKYPIGLITADEGIYAGLTAGATHKTNAANPNAYVVNGLNCWTMSPSFFWIGGQKVAMGYIAPNGNSSHSSASNSLYIRPVISLKDNTRVIGNGTKNNPYIFID